MTLFQDVYFIKILVLVLLVAAVIDLHTYKIPNLITLPAVVGALTYYTGVYGVSGLTFSLAGLGTGVSLLLIPYLMGGLGGGDVKLMGVVGAFLGAKSVFVAFLFSAIVGGIYAFNTLVLHHKSIGAFFKAQQAVLCEFLITRKIRPSAMLLCGDPPRLKYGLAIAFGTGLYIITCFSSITLL